MSVIEKGSINVYADLGFENAEAMLVKAQLAAKIGEIIKRRKLTQAQAADVLGIPQPKLSSMLRGRFRGISDTTIFDCLTRLGLDIEIMIKPAAVSKVPGRVSVVFA